MPTPMNHPTTASCEAAEGNAGEGKDDLSEVSNYELCGDIPVRHAFDPKDEFTPYHPHPQSLTRTALLRHGHLQDSNPSKSNYNQRSQSHNRSGIHSGYQPSQLQMDASPRANEPGSSSTTDLAKYLMRREMIRSGLFRFDDRPENYWAWKQSFQLYSRLKFDIERRA